MEDSWKSTVYNIINGQASHQPDTPAHKRVRPEASETAELRAYSKEWKQDFLISWSICVALD